MAIRTNKTTDGQAEQNSIPPPPQPPQPMGAYDATTDAYSPYKEPDDMYVYATQGPGRLPVRFTRQSWEQMGGDRGGYKEVPPAPPEVRRLKQQKEEEENEITT